LGPATWVERDPTCRTHGVTVGSNGPIAVMGADGARAEFVANLAV
jgi:hypothetical protein